MVLAVSSTFWCNWVKLRALLEVEETCKSSTKNDLLQEQTSAACVET
jgi:hypothetical protein